MKKLVWVFLLLLGACGGPVTYMNPAAGPPPAAPSDKAMVVFIRPSSFGGALAFTVLDEKANFLGKATPSSNFAVMVDPGPHIFTVWAENSDGLKADLAPGKTYFIEVQVKMGAMSARSSLVAIKPSVESWQKRGTWMAETKPMTTDFVNGQAMIDARKADAVERVRRAQEHFGQYNAEQMGQRTLAAADGI